MGKEAGDGLSPFLLQAADDLDNAAEEKEGGMEVRREEAKRTGLKHK